MAKLNEIKIDGYSIYIEKLQQVDETSSHDAGFLGKNAIEWTSQEIEKMMQPATKIMDSLRKATQDAIPDEMELTMQFDISLKGETPVLKIVSAETSAQLAVKFTWKNEKS